jgi:hypothetical protein
MTMVIISGRIKNEVLKQAASQTDLIIANFIITYNSITFNYNHGQRKSAILLKKHAVFFILHLHDKS